MAGGQTEGGEQNKDKRPREMKTKCVHDPMVLAAIDTTVS